MISPMTNSKHQYGNQQSNTADCRQLAEVILFISHHTYTTCKHWQLNTGRQAAPILTSSKHLHRTSFELQEKINTPLHKLSRYQQNVNMQQSYRGGGTRTNISQQSRAQKSQHQRTKAFKYLAMYTVHSTHVNADIILTTLNNKCSLALIVLNAVIQANNDGQISNQICSR